ncbi:MAG: hydroxymethylbilane synthase, partial [Bacteroidota bacterium]
LSQTFRIGTGALRRQALPRHYVPHFEPQAIRGNVDTRVKKMLNGEYDGLLLAYAGVKRMGYTDLVVRKLNVNTFTPAIAQGAIAVATREHHSDRATFQSILEHVPSAQAVRAERSFLHRMEGGCQTAIFGLATVVGETLTMMGGVASEDGQVILRETVEGTARDGALLGTNLAELLLTKGASKILNGKES